jgi:putative endonuclease
MWYTYIVECSDGTLYTGITNNIDKRLAKHNSGKGAKYTKQRIPVRLVYFEIYPSRSEASKREWVIKQLTRKEKFDLINNP